jgi:hypothetical protein
MLNTTNYFESYWKTFILPNVESVKNITWESTVVLFKTNPSFRYIIYIWLMALFFSFALTVWLSQKSSKNIDDEEHEQDDEEHEQDDELNNDNTEFLSLLTSLEIRYIKKTLTFLVDSVVNGYVNKKNFRQYMTYVKKYDKFHLRFGKNFRYTHQKNTKRESEKYRCDICLNPVYNNMPACSKCLKEWKESEEYLKNKAKYRCRSCDEYSGIDEYCMSCIKIDKDKMLQEL